MSLIEDIYNGEYYPAEQVKPDSEAFFEHTARAEELCGQLERLLTAQQREALETYEDEAAIVTDLYNLEFFRSGIRFGIRLILEALAGQDGLPDVHK